MLYTFVNKNLEKSDLGTDSVFYLDNRLNNYNKITLAKNKLKGLQSLKPNFGKEAIYIAPFKNSVYINGKYLYKNNLIKL